MKKHTSNPLRFIPTALGLAVALLANHARAAVTYWDPEGTYAAYSTNVIYMGQSSSKTPPVPGTLAGTWETTSWSTAGGGAAAPVAWVENTAACFAVGGGSTNKPNGTPDSTVTFTITMNSPHTIAGMFNGNLTPNATHVTINGVGPITWVAGNLNAMSMTGSSDGSTSSITVDVPMIGAANAGICAEQSGNYYLNGDSSGFAGGTYLGYNGSSFATGVWHFNDHLSFGTSPIILLNCTGGALVTETSGLNITNTVSMYGKYAANNNINGAAPQPATLNLDALGTPQNVTFSGPWTLGNGSGWTGANNGGGSIYATTAPFGNYTVVTLNTGHAVNDSADLINISGPLSGSCALTKGGSGILELSADNSAFSGPLFIANGTLRVSWPTALGCNGAVSTNGTVAVQSGATSGTLDLNGYAVNAALILNGTGNNSGNGALVNSNLTSTAVLNAPNGVLAALITSPFTSTTMVAPVTATVTGGGGSGATAFASLGVTPATFAVIPNTLKYSVLPNITVTLGGGSNAIVSMPLAAAAPAAVSSTAFITAPGFGYSSAPTVSVSGGTTSGTGTAPTVTANANNFQLMGIQISSPGSGYTSQPTIALSGTGVDPSGTAVGLISSVTLASSTSIGGPGNMVINSAIGDNGSGFSVTKVGAGTVTLGGVNTYSGATTVTGGKLVGIVGGSCASSAVTVQPSDTLGVSITDSTKQWTCANLTFADGTTTNEFNFGSVTPSTTLAPLNVTGTVTFTTGTPNVSVIVGTNLPPGTYPLMTCPGGLPAGAATANLSLPPHVTATLFSDGTTLSLVVAADTEPLKWAVSGTATWDINTTPNWKDTTALAVNYQESAAVPPVGDAVVFDDTYFSTPRTVMLNSTVSPVAVTVNSANSYTISGTGGIAGETGLSQQGSGTLELDTVNTYSGGTTISAGAITIGGAGQLGAGTYSAPIANNGTLTYNSTAPQTLSGPISGTGAVVQNGASTLVLSAANSYSGGTTIGAAGTLQIGDGVLDNGTTLAGDILDNGNLVITSFYPQTYAGSLSGSGSFTVNSPTSLTLNGVNTYTGNTIINASALIFNSTAPRVFSGVISGPGALVQAGAGTLTLNATSTPGNIYSGGTIINAGSTLSVNAIDNSGFAPTAIPATGVVTLGGAGATLQYTGSGATLGGTVTGTGTIDLPSGNLEVDYAKSGTITKTSGGTLTLAGTLDNASLGLTVNAGTVILSKTSDSTHHALGATTTVNSGGTLQLSGTGGDQIYSGVNVTVNSGGVFDLNGRNEGFATLNLNGVGSGSGALINSAAGPSTNTSAIVLGADSMVGGVGNLTLVGVISGAHALTDNCSGLLTLSGASTFSGGLTIPAGKSVQLNAAGSAGGGMTTIIGNGALTYNISGTYSNGITAGPTGIVNVNSPSGNTALAGDLTAFTGTINCNGGQVLLNVATNAAFPINAAATWNIANGVTLDLATPYVTDAASVIVNGVGNNTFGALRLDACNQTGSVLLNAANCTIGNGNAAASTISGIISDGGHGYGFTRTGTVNNTLVLSAANTYTGPTTNTVGTLDISATGSIKGDVTVTGGTLQLDSTTALASTATLNLATAPAAGAVNLTYSGSQTIKALYFGATQQASGTWGAVGSSATHQNAAFNPSGVGILSVTTGTVLSTTNVILSISNNANGTFTMDMVGTPGASYYLTSSGNITNSMSSWTPVVGTTNTANGSGNWSTVVSNTAPVFYRSTAVNPHP